MTKILVAGVTGYLGKFAGQEFKQRMIRPFSDKYYTLASFFTTVVQNGFDAPKIGTHTLKEYYWEFVLQL